MKTSTLPGLVPLGSARLNTRADTRGEKMELIPGRFYDDAGLRLDVTPLGSARSGTRAVSTGEHLELVPTAFWTPVGEL